MLMWSFSLIRQGMMTWKVWSIYSLKVENLRGWCGYVMTERVIAPLPLNIYLKRKKPLGVLGVREEISNRNVLIGLQDRLFPLLLLLTQ